MALLNGMFGQDQYGGLLADLQRMFQQPQQAQAAFNTPQALPTEPAFDMGISTYGGMRTPVFGQPPAQPEISAQSRMPQQAVQQQQPMQAPQAPTWSDRLDAYGDGAQAGAERMGSVGALLGGIGGFLTGDGGNVTVKALKAQGVSEDIARAAQKNPAIMAALASKLFGKGSETDLIANYKFAVGQGYKGSVMDYIAQQRSGAGEHGLQPIHGVDKDGNPAIIQLGKSGAAVQAKMPEGFRIARDPIKVDAGTEWILLDPQTRQPVGRQPKDIAGVQEQEAQGKARATLAAGMVGAKDTIKKIDTFLTNTDGIAQMVGSFDQYRPNWTMGDKGREALTQFNQLKGKAFLEAYAALKGGGAITEMEGTKAGQALERMDRSLSEKEFMAAVKDFRDAVDIGMKKLQLNAGVKPGGQSDTAPTIKKYNPATGRIE
jgi:hypothetical protein